MGILPDEIKPAMQGVIPSHVVTCSLDGTPNITAVSQVYYVDSDHVALSYQFFSKTIKNIRENPRALAWVSTQRRSIAGISRSSTTIPRRAARCLTLWICRSRRLPR